MIATVAIDAYLLDAYPEGSGEAGAWTNFGRALGGFMSTYVQLSWVQGSGPLVVFSIESGVVVASVLPIVVLQMLGKNIRHSQGPMNLATH